MNRQDHNKKRLFPRLLLLFSLLLCIAGLSGCSRHYDRDEAAAWFKENIFGGTVAVSKNYYERENEEGYTDRVWSAHLKDLPQVEFELISHSYYSLFLSHTMETNYHYAMGDYYLENYLEEHPGALSQVVVSRWDDSLMLRSMYMDREQLEDILASMEGFQDYVSRQDYPCEVDFSVQYEEPLTTPDLPGDYYAFHDTYSYETGDVEALGTQALKKFAAYALCHRLALDQFSQEELAQTASDNSSHRFILYRPDGTPVCYPDLILKPYNGMTIGCLYEVLLREGADQFQLNGTSDLFTFTALDGTPCTFSYANFQALSPPDEDGYTDGFFYYYYGDTVVPLTEDCCITSEELEALTGFTYVEMGSGSEMTR